MKPKINWLDRDLITGPYLIFCTTQAEYDAVVKHLGVEDPIPMFSTPQSDACVHHFTKDGQLVCCVALRNFEGQDPIAVAGLLVHEAVHVWQAYCDHIGEDSPSEEFEAYSIQTISQRLMWAFNQRGKS